MSEISSKLLNQVIEETLETEYLHLPDGRYVGFISEVTFKEGTSGANSRNPGKPYYGLERVIRLTDPSVEEHLGVEHKDITCNLLFLKFEDNGTLAKDGNQPLAQELAALGINPLGKSLQQLMDEMLLIGVKVDVIVSAQESKRKDADGDPIIYKTNQVIGIFKD